jgi:hypothetical protein
MLLRQIALLAKSKNVTVQELTRVSAALQRQVSRDLAPIWQVNATVDAFASEADVPHGYWKITVMDKLPVKGAAGFHLDSGGQPFADVEWSPAWSLAASHECLEMLVDPFGRQAVTGPSPKPGQGRVSFLVEVCDPCEAPQFAYKIQTATPNEVLVSDFYTPEYFSPTAGAAVRYSFSGKIKKPRQVLNGGYLSWQDPADGHVWQLFGPAQLGGFKDAGVGALDRESTDKHARSVRAGALTALPADASGKCNLTLDLSSGNLLGKNGNSTTVQIKDSTGSAVFLAISYDGTSIGSNVSSASFTIGQGPKALQFVYGAPVPNDLLTLTDPCGNTLDQFLNDMSDPTHQETVIGQ